MTFVKSLLATTLAVAVSGAALAAATPEQAAQLGKNLTAVGAEKPATPMAPSRPTTAG